MIDSDDKILELYLPFPPTINDYYGKKKIGKSRYISYIKIKGRTYREQAREALGQQARGIIFTEEKLLVEIVMYMPDRRQKRDLDNYLKPLLDACSKDDKDKWPGIWTDDSQINQLFIYRGKPARDGLILMKIGLAGPILPVPLDLPPNLPGL